MPKSNQINIRVNDPTNEAIEDFADKYDYTKTEACRRMIEDRLAGEGHLDHNRPVPDGGEMMGRLDELDEGLQTVNRELESVENQSVQFTRVAYLLAISIIWIGAVELLNPQAWLVVVTGVMLIGGLVYQYVTRPVQVFRGD